jgi:aldehyde dehydrogenase (NAD+)
MRIHNEEIFGPVLSVVRVESFDEAIEAANHSEFGLTSSIYTRDLTRAFRYMSRNRDGHHARQFTHTRRRGADAVWGMKNTGVGPREQGTEVFDFYTETKQRISTSLVPSARASCTNTNSPRGAHYTCRCATFL